MKKLIYALSAAACCSIATTACNTEFDDFDINTVEGIEALANSGNVTESSFKQFVKDAQSNTLLYEGDFTLYYDDFIDTSDYICGVGSPYHEFQYVLLCNDGTGRVCYQYWDIGHEGYCPPYNHVYREMKWAADTKSKSIIFCDEKLQKKGYDTAVTSLTLKYYDKESGLYIVEGRLPEPYIRYNKKLVLAYLSDKSKSDFAFCMEEYVYDEIYGPINDAALIENGYGRYVHPDRW